MLNDSEPPNLEATSTPGHVIIPQNSDQQGQALRVTAEVPRTTFVVPANSLMPEVAEEESTTIARFSSMNLEAEEGQICSRTVDQASSHTAGAWSAEDPLLLVLQKLRRDNSCSPVSIIITASKQSKIYKCACLMSQLHLLVHAGQGL